MIEKIGRVYVAWLEQIDLRNAYKFGETAVDLNAFATLVKDTFEIIKETILTNPVAYEIPKRLSC